MATCHSANPARTSAEPMLIRRRQTSSKRVLVAETTVARNSHQEAEPRKTPAIIVIGDTELWTPAARTPKTAMNETIVAGLARVSRTVPPKAAHTPRPFVPVSYTHLRAHE